jgi:hypothetical protein
MWKQTFKEVFRFLFDNPVIFLIILGNYALAFLFGPILGFVGFFFISLFYLVGLHGDINNLWESVKRLSKWAFFVAIVVYFLYFGMGFVSYLIYSKLDLSLIDKPTETLLFTLFYSFVLTVIIHPLWLALFGATSFEELKVNFQYIPLMFKKGFGAFLLLWFFIFVTLLAGLVKFLHFTVGMYAVFATFWLTYYTFLGVRLLQKERLKEV